MDWTASVAKEFYFPCNAGTFIPPVNHYNDNLGAELHKCFVEIHPIFGPESFAVTGEQFVYRVRHRERAKDYPAFGYKLRSYCRNQGIPTFADSRVGVAIGAG